MAPRKLQKQIEIIALNGIFRHLRIHALQFHQFLVEVLGNLLRPLHYFCALTHFLDLLLIGNTPQFFLNGFHLLVEVIFPLLLIQIIAYPTLDVVLQFQLLMFNIHVLETQKGPLIDVGCSKNPLLFFDREIHVGRHKVN